MKNCGLIYSSVGFEHVKTALAAILVARRFTACPIHWVTDFVEIDDLPLDGLRVTTQVATDLQPGSGKQRSRELKTRLNEFTPFAETLYLDCDTVVVKPLDGIWENLKDANLSFRKDRTPTVARCDHAFGHEKEYTWRTIGREAPQYNGGVFLWRSGTEAMQLFEIWAAEWRRFKHIDQLALARAVHVAQPKITLYPEEYNHMVDEGDQTWDTTAARVGHFIWDRKPEMAGFYACVRRLFPEVIEKQKAILHEFEALRHRGGY